MGRGPIKQSGATRALEHMVEHNDRAHCAVCLVTVAKRAHITSLIRDLRDLGWVIEKVGKIHCAECGVTSTHYKIVDTVPSKRRASIPDGVRKRFLARRGHRDAYTCLPVPAKKLELDHRTPHAEHDTDEDPVTDDNIDSRYQPLTAANNQVKRQACEICRSSGTRAPFMGIDYWLEGNAARPETCDDCPWANPEKWRAALNALVPEANRG